MRRRRRDRSWKIYQFRGKPHTLNEISALVGISAKTLRKRWYRGLSFELPLLPRKKQARKVLRAMRLTGDMQHDLRMIVRARHEHMIRNYRGPHGDGNDGQRNSSSD